jgi:hypothetical protein
MSSKNVRGYTLAEAVKEYERFHWGNKSNGIMRGAWAPDPRDGAAALIGGLFAVTYVTQKRGDKRPRLYEHIFGSPEGEAAKLPLLVYNREDGGSLIVLRTPSTTYGVRPEGIVR